MSEPLQLIGRIFVTREQLAQFNARMIDSSERYSDWGDWLGDKKWYGDESQEEIVAGANCGTLFEDWFSIFFKEHELWPGAGEFMKVFGQAFNDYDDEAGCWKFMVFEFSENYLDFMSAVNALRQIDGMPGPPIHGQLTIVPYVFGLGFNECEVVVTIADGKSTLREQTTPEFQAWATHCFQTIEFPRIDSNRLPCACPPLKCLNGTALPASFKSTARKAAWAGALRGCPRSYPQLHAHSLRITFFVYGACASPQTRAVLGLMRLNFLIGMPLSVNPPTGACPAKTCVFKHCLKKRRYTPMHTEV